MAVEIRELVIKTEVRTVHEHTSNKIKSKDISLLKSELLDACKRMLAEGNKRAHNKR